VWFCFIFFSRPPQSTPPPPTPPQIPSTTTPELSKLHYSRVTTPLHPVRTTDLPPPVSSWKLCACFYLLCYLVSSGCFSCLYMYQNTPLVRPRQPHPTPRATQTGTPPPHSHPAPTNPRQNKPMHAPPPPTCLNLVVFRIAFRLRTVSFFMTYFGLLVLIDFSMVRDFLGYVWIFMIFWFLLS